MKHVNTLCGRNSGLLNVKLDGTYSNQCERIKHVYAASVRNSDSMPPLVREKFLHFGDSSYNRPFHDGHVHCELSSSSNLYFPEPIIANWH